MFLAKRGTQAARRGPRDLDAPDKCHERALRGALAGTLGLLLAACGGGAEPVAGVLAAGGLPPAELTEVVFEGFSGDGAGARVQARTAVVDTSAGVATLRDVYITFREPEHGRVEIRAPYGEVRLESEDFVLSGGVEGTTEAGERFLTEEVRYTSQERRIFSETPVRLDRSNLSVQAAGMEIELDGPEPRVRLIGGVRGVMEPS